MSKQELPLQYKKAVNRYKEINVDGLTLYPIKVSEYEEFLIARQALSFATQSLPIEMMSMPVLKAFFKIDYERAMRNEVSTGLFISAVLGLSLALRLTQDGSITEAINRFQIITDANDPSQLKQLKATVNGEEQIVITPVQYAKLRVIIAAQNGVEIPDEDDNPELLQAEHDLAEKQSDDLEVSIESIVTSVAAIEGKDDSDLYSWEILKLHRHLEQHKRRLDYLICGIGEAQGTTWKSGNPVPSPWFEKLKKGSNALIGVEHFAGGQGLEAIKNAT